MRIKEIIKPRNLIATLVLLICIGGGSFYYLKDNFHPITTGEAYRSAQLDRDEFEFFIKRHQIKSVLNLRGSTPGEDWYKEEMQVCSDLNIAHYDLALSATREPTPEEVKKLIEIFNAAPRPLLLHCKAGADRSGLAAAMWKVVVDREQKAEAEKQLSIFFGHLPFGDTAAMDNFFASWNPTTK